MRVYQSPGELPEFCHRPLTGEHLRHGVGRLIELRWTRLDVPQYRSQAVYIGAGIELPLVPPGGTRVA